MAETVEEWADGLRVADALVSVDGHSVTVSTSSNGSLMITIGSQPPEEIVLILDAPEAESVMFGGHAALPGIVAIACGPRLRDVRHAQRNTRLETRHLLVHAEGDRPTISLQAWTLDKLTLERCNAIPDSVEVTDLHLNDAKWDASKNQTFSRELRILEIAADCEIVAPVLEVDAFYLHGGATIRFQSINSLTATTCTQLGHTNKPTMVQGSFVLHQVASPLTVGLLAPRDSSSRQGRTSLTVGAGSSVSVSGVGDLVIAGDVDGLILRGNVTLTLSRATTRVWRAHGGPVKVSAFAGSSILGGQSNPLSFRDIGEVVDVSLLRFNPYSMSFNDINALRRARAVVPHVHTNSIPATRALRGMNLGHGAYPRTEPSRARTLFEKTRSIATGESTSDPAERVRRSQFWAEFVQLLEEKHAPGAVQSNARFSWAKARQKALRFGREKALLWTYSLVGYGERILKPLVLYFVLGVAIFALFNAGILDADVGPATPSLPVILTLPLAVFRISVGTIEVSNWNLAAVLTWQAVGIVLLFFTVSAIRRIANPG